jgi:hypothetical protein
LKKKRRMQSSLAHEQQKLQLVNFFVHTFFFLLWSRWSYLLKWRKWKKRRKKKWKESDKEKREDKLTHSKLDETNYYLAMGDLKFSLKIAWLSWASWIDPLQAPQKKKKWSNFGHILYRHKLTLANNIGYMISIALSKGHGMNFGAIGNNSGNTLDAYKKNHWERQDPPISSSQKKTLVLLCACLY